MAAASAPRNSDLWSLPNKWLREIISLDPNASLTTAQVAQWLEESRDQLPEELLQRDTSKVIAYICNTHYRLKRVAREKQTKQAVGASLARGSQGESSDDEPLANWANKDKKRESKSSQGRSLDAIEEWLAARVAKDPSPLPRAEIERWLGENKSRLPESFLSRERLQQRQHCYDVFARKGGMRMLRKNKSKEAVGPSGSHPSETTVRQTLDGGAGPSGRLPSDFDARPSHRDFDAEEREPQLKKQKLAANLPSHNAYSEWTFRGNSSGHFKFKGDPATSPPKSADFAAALKKHTGQLSALVASVKGWTVKIVSKGPGRGGEPAYVARYRYKKKDFMPKLEKVEEFLKRHPNLRKGAALGNGLNGSLAAPPVVEQTKEEQGPPALHQTAEHVGTPATERPRTGKKDVLGEFLHTWTLLTDLEMRLEEHLAWAERSKERPKLSDAHATQWQYSEATADGHDTLRECPYGMDRNGPHLLQKREAGLPWGPRRMWSRRRAGGGLQWTSVAQGWFSRALAWQGLASSALRAEFSAWRPTSHAWTSHALTQATAPPQELQGGQKVLDVRLHPQGAPLLVVGCNNSPNELILYDLLTGQAKSLQGHNSFIQAVEFTATGDRIVSCGKNTLRVWESATGREIHSIGPDPGTGGELEAAGHTDRIGCMAIDPFNTALAATSGRDRRLLLWDVVRGQLVADLNRDLRIGGGAMSVDTMVFSRKRTESTLLCGEDADEGAPAMISLWDVEQQKRIVALPAHDKYVVTCQVSSDGDTFITGAGDGCAALWDVREKSARGIVRIKLGNDCEVTSVSFSPCDVYFQASCTTNRTHVFDRRYMSLAGGAPPPPGRPLVQQSAAAKRYRPLHCLGHGPPMPTRTPEQRDQAGVLAGYVDDGDQGVNHAHWFHHGTTLVTASGNGSVTVWDVSLGVPCLKTFEKAHAGSCNAVAVSLDDRTICSGGDDQKLTLYQDTRNGLHSWRLTALAFA